MVITSPDNAKVLLATKLLDKKYRKQAGKYLIEGERLVNDAILHGAQIEEIFVKESCNEKFDFENQIVVADKVFAKMCDTVNSQGILAVVRKPEDSFVEPCGNCLVLDGLQDPGNAGTLVRTAAACGFSDVFAVNCVDVYSPKVLRAAMSAHFCVKLWQCDSIESVFQNLKGFITVAADMSGTNVFKENLSGKIALILGNEGNGLSQYSKSHSQKTVSLPMLNDFESLNAAVAGSVLMYQIFATQTKF